MSGCNALCQEYTSTECASYPNLAQTYASWTGCPRTPYRKQKPGNHRDKHKCKCNQCISKYASMHLHRIYTGNNMRRHPPAKATDIYNTGLATQKNEVKHSMRQYWSIRSELAMIDDIAMTGKRIMIPVLLQKHILQ